MRTSSRLGRAVRQATQVRVGTGRWRVARPGAGGRRGLRRHLLGDGLRGDLGVGLGGLLLGRALRLRRGGLGGSARSARRSASAPPSVARFGFASLGRRSRRPPPRPSSARAWAWPARQRRPRRSRPRRPARRRAVVGRRVAAAAASTWRSASAAALRLGDGDVAADVDAPAGQSGGQSGVLALAADGQREHPLGHGHAGDPVLLVDVDATGPGPGSARWRRTRRRRRSTG